MHANSSNSTRTGPQKLSVLLQRVVAQESQLAAATQRYAWGTRGSPMQSVKRLLAEQRRQIDHWLAEVTRFAERAGLALGHPVIPAAASQFTESSSVVSEQRLIRDLLRQHERMASQLRRDVARVEPHAADGSITRLLNRLLDFHETTAWMLRLLLETRDSSA